MTRTSYDEKLDKIALKISQAIDGERLTDIVSVSAMISAYAIREGFPDLEERREILNKIIKFMEQIVINEHDPRQ